MIKGRQRKNSLVKEYFGLQVIATFCNKDRKKRKENDSQTEHQTWYEICISLKGIVCFIRIMFTQYFIVFYITIFHILHSVMFLSARNSLSSYTLE